MLIKSSMPVYFPDEESRRAVIEANHLNSRAVSMMITEGKMHWTKVLLDILIKTLILSAIGFFTYRGKALELPVDDPQMDFTFLVVFFLGIIYSSSLLGIITAAVATVATKILSREKKQEYMYEVIDGTFVKYRAPRKYVKSSTHPLVKLQYLDQQGRKHSAYTDTCNLYLLDKMLGRSMLKIVKVQVWGFIYQKAFLEEFFCEGERPPNYDIVDSEI